MAQRSFKQQVLQAREDAIVAAASRFLATKGFDLMTVDGIAAEVGIAKASLYKHFPSKEALAAAAMVKLMDRALVFLREIQEKQTHQDKRALTLIQATVEWTLRMQLAGEMPILPSQHSGLRATLTAHQPYLQRLVDISDILGGWITEAQREGAIDPALPADVVLYTVFSQACNAVVPIMKVSGHYTDDQIVQHLSQICLTGLQPQPKGP